MKGEGNGEQGWVKGVHPIIWSGFETLLYMSPEIAICDQDFAYLEQLEQLIPYNFEQSKSEVKIDNV